MVHLEAAMYPMAENGGARSLIDHFAVLADPRQRWKVVYPLPEVLLLVLCGTLAGAEDFVESRRWGMVNQGFLRRFLPFAEGIPSHDTGLIFWSRACSSARTRRARSVCAARNADRRDRDALLRSRASGDDLARHAARPHRAA